MYKLKKSKIHGTNEKKHRIYMEFKCSTRLAAAQLRDGDTTNNGVHQQQQLKSKKVKEGTEILVLSSEYLQSR